MDVERDKKKRRHEREKDRRDRERDEKDMEHDFKDLDNVQRRLKPSRRVDDAMTEHLHEVGEGAENFATFSISTSSYDDKNALKSEYFHAIVYGNMYMHGSISFAPMLNVALRNTYYPG